MALSTDNHLGKEGFLTLLNFHYTRLELSKILYLESTFLLSLTFLTSYRVIIGSEHCLIIPFEIDDCDNFSELPNIESNVGENNTHRDKQTRRIAAVEGEQKRRLGTNE